MDGARWNWYSRRGAINSSQLHNRRQNHRQMHTQSSKRRKERVARSAPRADDPARFGAGRSGGWPRSRRITLHDEIKVALVLERATPRAHTHLHTQAVRWIRCGCQTLANPRTSLHPCAATPRMHTYTRTHAHLITRSIHSLTLREYTWLHTLRICKANWFCKLSKKKKRKKEKKAANIRRKRKKKKKETTEPLFGHTHTRYFFSRKRTIIREK